MNYIFGLMMNIVSLAAVVCFTVVLFTWFILFPLWALEIRIDEKNTMTKSDWDSYNRYAKDDDTITPKQWRKYGYAYKQWYLHSQRDIPFWAWYEKMRKKKRYMMKSWEYKKETSI